LIAVSEPGRPSRSYRSRYPRLKAKNDKAARAQDARRKIVAGALALEHTTRNPGSEFARVLVPASGLVSQTVSREIVAGLTL
jgi:hypothetical protein